MPKIIDKSIKEVMSSSYINYAMSVITDRALPDVRDGLKPVHRRILHSMNELSNYYNKPYKKSARIVGDVIGKYHPHGDTAVYEAMVRMAQDFSMSQPLVDGQGNFGSIDGDAPAAMRYTESRMSRIAGEAFKDINKGTIEWRENYDGSEKEPEVLPMPFPNLLVNGVEGIAVGMASSIPPHNLKDVIASTISLMKNPNLSSREFADILKAPDFPTAGTVYNLDGFYDAVESGSGRVKLRSKWTVEKRNKQGAESIVITEIPYQVNKAKLLESISALVQTKQIEGIIGLRDESNKEGIRIVIELKKGTDPETVFSILAAKTTMETTVSYNCMMIVDGKPKLLGLKEIAEKWIEFRKKVVYSRYLFERNKLQSKATILEGYLKAVNKLDETISLIRSSANSQEAKEGLISLLEINDIQAQAILDLKLQKLTGLEINAIEADYEKTILLIEELNLKLNTPSLIQKDIIKELEDLSSLYGADRKTEISHSIQNIDREDLIPKEESVLMITRGGYMKRMPISSLKSQRRGTRGKRGLETYDNDHLDSIYQVNSHDLLLIFDDDGQVYGVKAYQIPSSGGTEKGRHVKNIVEGLEKEIKAVVVAPNDIECSILTVSKNGLVKKTLSSEFMGSERKGGKKGVALAEGDSLLSAHAVFPGNHIVLVSSNAKSIRFESDSVRNMGRNSRGVSGIKLAGDEIVVGSYVFDPKEEGALDLLVISENGVGKKTALKEYPLQSRSGKGSFTFKKTARTGDLVSAIGGKDNLDLIMFTSNNVTNKIQIEDVPRRGRAASGAALINLDKNAKLIAVTASIRDEEVELNKIGKEEEE